MDKKIKENIKKIIDNKTIESEPIQKIKINNKKIKCIYREVVYYDGNPYIYYIDWVGIEDGEDGGRWSEPYDIEEDF